METMAVSITKGVMGPLLAKLTKLMGDEYKMLKGVRKQVSFLKDELSTINAFLEKLELMDELNPLDKNWRSHAREMAYDIEDCIDDFMLHLGGADPKEGFIKKTTRRLNTLRDRHRIANQIEQLKNRVSEVSERYTRYKLEERVCSSSSMVIDPRVKALYTETSKLVGIEDPRDELVKWLIDAQQQLKVVSIVGLGGLGKTTLAKEVNHRIGEHFECNAFVSVSQRPDMTRILYGIQSKLGIVGPSSACDVQEIIDNIRGYLKHRRYFVVLDDLWDAQTWNILSCAFPENDKGSRVMVTTRVQDVASKACLHQHECIYRMKTLSSQDSRRLFFKRIFGSEDGCPSQFEEVSAEILKRCSGLPLAIITIASLLACKPEKLIKDWESIPNSIGTQFGLNPTLEGMRQILDLSYKDLPTPLKTCLLYLGIYPEDCVIKRFDLVRQWIAEGYISNMHGRDSEDVAKSYFNELVNRSLIQPARTYCGEVMSCTVHDMMLGLIVSRCEEDNFVSVAYGSQDMGNLHDRKVRRLSLDFRVGSAPNDLMSGTTSSSMSQVRSIALFGGDVIIPPPLFFRCLRVLTLEYGFGTMDEGSKLDLTSIGQLLQLRYLKVVAYYAKAVELPGEIQGLQYLETLEMQTNECISIPSDIVHLPRLAHLIVKNGLSQLDGIGNMKSLRSLRRFHMEDVKDIKAIGELNSLRNIMLCSSRKLVATEIDALVTSLGKLHDLRCLDFCCSINDEENRLGSAFCPPRQIEILQLRGWWLPFVPKYISSDLRHLCHLELQVLTSTEEVRVLGELPSLIYLYLHGLRGPCTGSIIVFGTANSFPALEHLNLRVRTGDAMSYLGFEAAVMPKLTRRSLNVNVSEWGGTTPVGMEHLLNLQEIVVDIHYGIVEADPPETTSCHVIRFFTNYAEQVHRSRPSIHFSRVWTRTRI